MKKCSILLPFILLSLGGCATINRMNNLVNESSDSIQANREAVERSTAAIHRNARVVEASTRTIEENRRLIESASGS